MLEFPKTYNFINDSLRGKGDLELANEVKELLLQLNHAKLENERLQNKLDGQRSSTPQYPKQFYIHGNMAMSYRVSDKEIQEYIDELTEVQLEDGQYAEISNGDTIVMKSARDGAVRYIVAKGYAEFISGVDGESDACCQSSCGCSSHLF